MKSGIEEGKEYENKSIENLTNETKAGNLPHLRKYFDFQVEEFHWTQNKCDQKKSSLQHIIVKTGKKKKKRERKF